MRFTEDFVLKVEEEIKMEDIAIENETFIRPSKIEIRGRDEGANHEDEQEKEKRQKLEGGGGGGGGGGGLLDNLLSKLTSPRPTTDEDHALGVNNDHHENGDAREGGGDGEGGGGGGGEGGGGGVINNLISNLFPKRSEGEGEDVKNDGGEERLEGRNEENEVIKKVEEESEGGNNINSNGGSLISNLVQDVAAPEGDEASILIQSIVHD
ncbi:RNA-binding protein cabeza-like [Chenopodium quinoa]|uniref:RNA-binding protein cabeza-like n=1 Tax=Chenopodium quinoa TaxID=63459 RepID=UPI000B76F645|nr:RNA-binding protein cabeza-like [Chenopodium quinoa]